MVPDLNETIEYKAPLSTQDMALIELNDYINAKSEEIYTENTNIYKEMARQSAIELVYLELIKLTDTSPHVDYEYMREVVASMQ